MAEREWGPDMIEDGKMPQQERRSVYTYKPRVGHDDRLRYMMNRESRVKLPQNRLGLTKRSTSLLHTSGAFRYIGFYVDCCCHLLLCGVSTGLQLTDDTPRPGMSQLATRCPGPLVKRSIGKCPTCLKTCKVKGPGQLIGIQV